MENKKNSTKFIARTIMVGGYIIMIFGFVLFIWQVYMYLLNGSWIAQPLLLVFEYFPRDIKFISWIFFPKSWFGLHKIIYWILEFIPTSLISIFVGFAIIGWYFSFEEKDQ
ncbi:MAG: hypothetical protein NT178_18880 [Proteobacteria bacterium]|nr:hypothetical protein [Pseudomonadota bacterium]